MTRVWSPEQSFLSFEAQSISSKPAVRNSAPAATSANSVVFDVSLVLALGAGPTGKALDAAAVWAAVGGRATLIGPIVGAFIVNGAKSWLTVTAPEFWLYFLGALFIAVTLFLPDGVVGLVKKLKAKMTTTKGAAQ